MDKGGLWPSEELLPGFRPSFLSFSAKCHEISLVLLAGLAAGLGYEEDYFNALHCSAAGDDCQVHCIIYRVGECIGLHYVSHHVMHCIFRSAH